MPASSEMAKDADEAKSESSWAALAKGRKDTGGALTWRVIWRSWRSQDRGRGLKADPWIPKGRWATGQLGQKLHEKKKVKSRTKAGNESGW